MPHPISKAATVCALALLLSGPGVCAAEDRWAYEVKTGDTLIGIHARLLRPSADWRTLQRINRIADPRRLMPGSRLEIPIAFLREQVLLAEVLHAHGDVTVQRSGAAAAQPLVGGATLAAGDVVRTGPQSSATLLFGDGSRTLLRPDSLLRIERSVRLGDSSAVDTRLRLDSGSVDTRVPRQTAPRFEIRTPVANLGVRGTEFRVRASPEQSVVEVLDGRVVTAVGTGARPQPVDAGFGALASAQGVTPPRSLLAAPVLRDVPSRIERLPLRLPWSISSGAVNYRAQVFDGDVPDRLVLDGLFQGEGARWSDDLPDGRYRLNVRAVDSQGVEGRDASTLFTLKARPEPPFVTRPRASERTADETVIFAWTRNPGAARYRLQVADTPDFAAPRMDRDDIAGTEQRLALPVGTHHWRLASIRADGDVGPWSDPLAVTRVALPLPPASQAPQSSADGVLLRWRESAGARYQLQVARDADFARLLHDERTAETQWLLRQPEPGRYFVRVRAIDADGFAGPFGSTQEVDVPRSPWWWLLLLPLLLVT